MELLADKGDRLPFSDSASLFLSGRLGSMDAVQVVTLLEQRCGIDFAETGLDQAQIDSVAAIQSLLEKSQKLE
jgi:acyl carrier protein